MTATRRGSAAGNFFETRQSLLLLMIVLLLFALPSAAQTCDYSVTSLADSGAGTLRAGLGDPAVTNICINGSGTITLASTLSIVNPVTITGSVTIDGNNLVQIFNVSLSSSSYVVRINGLTLTHGNSGNGGGALQVTSGNVTLVGTTISGNTAVAGGGVYNQSNLTLSQCNISSNTATSGSGGGIYNDANAVLTLQGTTVTQNSSTAGAGGLYNAGTASITGGIFTGNTGAYGGAIYNEFYANLPIAGGTTFSNNTASVSGGAIFNIGSTMSSQMLFTGNAAQGTGVETPACGGAICNSGTATIGDSTFTQNSSAQNGGAVGNTGTLTLVNDTLYSNSAVGNGSSVDNESSGVPSIKNSILVGATPSAAPSCYGCTGITGNNVIDVEPYLGPLANNGGPTYTMMPLPGGPEIAAGNPNDVIDDFDQRGFARLSANAVDIGAVQSHYSAITYLTQPSNALINQTITPPVQVQVVEVDPSTSSNNYPQGVPVNVSLYTSQGVPASTSLAGTLTQQPATTAGVTAATFPDLAVNTAGGYELQATIVPTSLASSASLDPAYGAMSSIFQISNPPVVTLSWQPAPLTYGPVPASELNAVATVNGSPATGTFLYTFTAGGATINVGQIYPVGSYGVQVTFTPAGSVSQYTLGTSLQITQATPVLTWATPAPIYTSTPLGGAQLNATAAGVTGAALPGTFVYNPAAGTTLTAGSQLLNVTFTPTDAANYTTAAGRVAIQVNAVTAAKIAIQESVNLITFGQSDTFTAVVTGTDGNPFSGGTATFTVDGAGIGSAAIVNGSGAITDASLTGGTHQVAVSYTDTGITQTLTAATTVTVNKATPVLTWPTPAAIYTSTALSGTQLNATATGVNSAALAGTFVYSPAAGAKLPAGAQTLSATFTPTDTTDYNSNTAQVSIQVNAPTAANVVIQESANPITFGQSETFTAVVTGTDGLPLSGGTATFSVDGAGIGSAAIVNGSGAVIDATLTGGAHEVSVSYANTATSQTLTGSTTLTVNKAAPVLAWTTPAAIYTSTALSATQLNATANGVNGAALPGTFVYNPAAGTTLAAGSHVLSATFTPTDSTDYSTNSVQVTIQVNTPNAASISIQESANPITFGKSETLTAVLVGSDGQPYSGGTASFTSDGTAIGSATVASGSASISISSLTAGTHQIGVTYTNSSLPQPLSGSAALTVNKATPVLAWAAPAAIFTVTPLSSTQLDATAAGVNGAALPGTFVYNPAAGAMLPAGTQTLSTTFTPADAVDYSVATAQVTIQVGYSTIAIASVSPTTTALATAPLTITITGSGFTSTSVAEVNGAAIATKVQSATALTSTIPAADLASVGTLKLSVYDPASKYTSNVVKLPVTAPAPNLTFSINPTTGSGQQPTINLGLNSPYPSDLQGTLTLTFSSSGTAGIDDPAIQFSTGGRTLNFTIPANSTTTPQVALQTGTVAGTITVTLTLTAGGVDVTPAGLAPVTLVIAPSAPVITSVAFTNNSQGQITVVVSGFSNTRDVTTADFVFTGADASRLHSSHVNVSVVGLFSPWYGSPDSDQYGSEFTYTQNFQLSKPDAGLTGVAVTLTNSVGTSGSVNSQ